MINGADAPKPILVLDFDGTLCIGDAPVWSYADAVLNAITSQDTAMDDHLRADIRNRLAAFLDGTTDTPAYSDGYDAVAQLTAPHTTQHQRQAAYTSSRRALAGGVLEVHAPLGMNEFLREMHSMVTVVLVTNAPAPGIRETVDALGLTAQIDRIITDADKPGGWEQLIPELLASQGSQSTEAAMVVGDIWFNDIAVPLRLGCATAYIDRFGQRQGAAHIIARDFPSLYPDIRQWAHDPLGFVETHPPGLGTEIQSSSSPTPSSSPIHRTGTQ